jgi:hypothetical protein
MDARPLPRPKRPVNPLVRAKWLWRILVSCVFTGYYLGYYVFVQQWSDVWTTQEGFFLFFFPVTLSLVGYYCYLKASFMSPGHPPSGWVRVSFFFFVVVSSLLVTTFNLRNGFQTNRVTSDLLFILQVLNIRNKFV